MPDAVFFDATLHPSRSLSRRGLVVLICLVITANAAVALRAFAAGGWPILPFLGLDILGLSLAFALNNRAARLTEHIRLDREALTITHVAPSGRARDWSFEPAWVRVSVDEAARSGGRVTVTTHGKGVAVAEFLTPRERREMAAALRDALSRRAREMASA